MPDPKDNDALTAIVTLAARLRDTAAAVADRADSAARSGPWTAAGRDSEPAGDAPKGHEGEPGPDAGWGSADFGALIDLAAMLRDSVPDDLRDRLSGSVRETLLSARALIDWYLERDAATGASHPSDAIPADPEATPDGV